MGIGLEVFGRNPRATNQTGFIFVPYRDGRHILDLSRQDYKRAQCFFAFVDDDNRAVTPTAGTITVRGSFLPNQWLVAVNGVVNATDVEAVNPSYVVPTFTGGVLRVALDFDGVRGVSRFQSCVWAEF